MCSASSSLTSAGVGLPDSRSFRKGCIVIPPMLCYLLLKSSDGLDSPPIDSASLGTSPRPQSLCRVAAAWDRLAQRSECCTDFGREKFRLFPRSEVASLIDLIEVDEILI